MMRNSSILWLALALLAAGPAWSAENVARVTAAVGNTASGGEAVGMREGLPDGADLETGDDGNCALLVDQDTLMELCGNTSLRLERKDDKPDGPRVVKLDKGEIRMVVEPRVREERIEIHTPAAIATLLGTVLHVSVDALGITTVTSVASHLTITSNDKNIPGSTTIGPGEQIVMEPGQPPPPQPTEVSRQTMGSLGGCLIDFHAVSLAADRGAREAESMESAIESDIIDGQLPAVAAAAENALLASVVDKVQAPPDPNTNSPYNPVDAVRQSAGGLPTSGGGFTSPGDSFPGGDCTVIPGRGCL